MHLRSAGPAGRRCSLLIALLLAPAIASGGGKEPAAAADRPNVLLVISDDQGYGDFGFNGNPLVRTPNLDRLASESALFGNFVVAAACSPTRAALFTGRDHLLTGVWGVPPRANLRPDEARMPAFFKAAGYRTLHVGKLDSAKMGHSPPSAFGWDDWLGGGGYEHRDPMLYQQGNNRRGQGWAADLWTDEVLAHIDRHRDRPWFATVAFILPHLPWICDQRYSAPLLAQGCSADLAACYGCIAQLDHCLGRLLDGLCRTGQHQRTIVVFLSDNGATGPEAKHSTDGIVAGPDWARRNVARLRGHKAQVWENGIRVPLLVRWPGRIPAGQRRQFGCVEDLLPTLLDLAGVAADGVPHHPFSGISLRPALEDPAAAVQRPDAFRIAIAGPGAPRDAAPGEPRRYEDHHLTLRGPRFKYHALPGGRGALYDLDADPGESADLHQALPEVASQMAAECRRRWEAIVAGGRAFAPPADDRRPRTPARGKAAAGQ